MGNTWNKEKIKILSKFSRTEYMKLQKSGMFFEFYPGYTGNYKKDIKRAKMKLMAFEEGIDGKDKRKKA